MEGGIHGGGGRSAVQSEEQSEDRIAPLVGALVEEG